MKWFDREVDRLEEDLDQGIITNKEFRDEMRSLQAELEGQAQDAAESAYNDFMGTW